MKALRFTEFGPVSGLTFADLPDPEPNEASAVVKVLAASINPSDVKNVEGKMEHTTLPRVPGRDFAGIVLDGPSEWLGRAVWGTGGEIGYSVNGSHAELIAVPVASLRRKPDNLSFAEAAVVGATYIAAWLGVVEYARIEPGEKLIVIGASGGVGGSAAQIGKWRGAQVIGIDRAPLAPGAPAAKALDRFFSTEVADINDVLREATNGGGANVVFDTVGGQMFEPSLSALAHRGRLVEISSFGSRRVSFDLVNFYHSEIQLFGADTRKRDAIASATLLDALRPLFYSGTFAAPRIDRVIPLGEGRDAYQKLAAGEVRGRLVLAQNTAEALST